MKKNDRVAALQELIEKYQKSYYDEESEISDAEFDLLWDELKSLDPNNPLLKKIGSTSDSADLEADAVADSIFPKKRHIIPMGSQDKAANPDELLAWTKKMNIASYVVQYKLDGASLELQYENGYLKAAVTRGDGITGDEITANALCMAGVLQNLSDAFSGGIRGEVIMYHDIWKSKYPDKANCRNAANGIMRRKDSQGCGDLTFISYDASVPGNDSFFSDEIAKIAWLRKQGFLTTQTKEFNTPQELIDYREETAKNRSSLGFDIDGLVIKDRITDMADLRKARPEKQIAFKFELETAFSILKKIEWSENGATYTPIGIIDPVRIAGTQVQRANLNNPGMIRSLGLQIGSAVKVVKRGEIIPKIEGLAPKGFIEEPNEKTDIEFPKTCNTCGTGLENTETRLFCPNSSCPKRLHHRLEKWVSVLDIRELGDKLLAQLFNTGRIKNISDLYTLTENELASLDRMGELSSAKVIRNLRLKRELSLSAFVAGFDFEGVGELIVQKIADAGFDTLEKIRAASLEDLSGVYGLGEITAHTVFSGLRDSFEEMNKVLESGIISIAQPPDKENSPLKGKSFCFTGELKTMKRNQAEERVKILGGSSKASVVKDLSYLVTNDPESGSGKNKKARELGIPIINEEEFLQLLDNAGVKTTENANKVQGELFNENF